MGKTLIALYLARRLAEPTTPTDGSGQQTVLIDADLTGTSLADVLELAAPKRRRDFYSVKETIDLLRKHGKQPDADWPRATFAMLDRFLFCNPLEYRRILDTNKAGDAFQLRDFLWHWNPNPSGDIPPTDTFKRLRVIPSSGFPKDLSDCIPHLYKEDLTGYLEMRMAELIWTLWRRKGRHAYDAVVSSQTELFPYSD